jgi:hypothetical protein
MRYYFHLINGKQSIADAEGVELCNVSTIEREVSDAVEKFRVEAGSSAARWAGWRLKVVDAAGNEILTRDLGAPDR